MPQSLRCAPNDSRRAAASHIDSRTLDQRSVRIAICALPYVLRQGTFCVHSKQDVFKEGSPREGGADLAAPARGGANPATSTNSTDAKGKLPRTPVRHALYNVPDAP